MGVFSTRFSRFAVALIAAELVGRCADFYAAPMGTAGGDGSMTRPWDLTTALGHPAEVRPGDTIWLRAGTYGGGGAKVFRSLLAGHEGAPIVVRGYPREAVRINGSIHAEGPWATFWGFEITNTAAGNRNATSETFPPGLTLAGRGQKAINLVIHNTGHPGIGFWNGVGDGGEIHGCLLYGNGLYEGGSWLRGSAIYAQNQDGTRYITDVIAFRNFNTGLNLYTENGYTDGFHLEGNITFDHPSYSLWGTGGSNPMKRLRVLHNYVFHPEGRPGIPFALGHGGTNIDAVIEHNYVAGSGDIAMNLVNWQNVVFRHNTVYSGAQVVGLRPSPPARAQWNFNTYYGPTRLFNWNYDSHLYSEWKSWTGGYDNNSVLYTDGRKPANAVFVRANKYEPGRGHVAVFNWERQAEVEISLAGVVADGASYEIRDAQNYFGAPVASGVYAGGTVTLPLTGTAISPILGVTHMSTAHTSLEFGAFVVTSDYGPSGAERFTQPGPAGGRKH